MIDEDAIKKVPSFQQPTKAHLEQRKGRRFSVSVRRASVGWQDAGPGLRPDSAAASSPSSGSGKRRQSIVPASDDDKQPRFKTYASQLRVRHCQHECLKAVPLFQTCSAEFVEMLAEQVTAQIFNAGCEIVRQGELGESMYILNRGEVEIMVHGNRVALLGDGSVFGEMAAICKLQAAARRTATVRAKTICDCRVIGRDALSRTLSRFRADEAIIEGIANKRLSELRLKGLLPNTTEWWRPLPTKVVVGEPPEVERSNSQRLTTTRARRSTLAMAVTEDNMLAVQRIRTELPRRTLPPPLGATDDDNEAEFGGERSPGGQLLSVGYVRKSRRCHSVGSSEMTNRARARAELVGDEFLSPVGDRRPLGSRPLMSIGAGGPAGLEAESESESISPLAVRRGSRSSRRSTVSFTDLEEGGNPVEPAKSTTSLTTAWSPPPLAAPSTPKGATSREDEALLAGRLTEEVQSPELSTEALTSSASQLPEDEVEEEDDEDDEEEEEEGDGGSAAAGEAGRWLSPAQGDAQGAEEDNRADVERAGRSGEEEAEACLSRQDDRDRDWDRSAGEALTQCQEEEEAEEKLAAAEERRKHGEEHKEDRDSATNRARDREVAEGSEDEGEESTEREKEEGTRHGVQDTGGRVARKQEKHGDQHQHQELDEGAWEEAGETLRGMRLPMPTYRVDEESPSSTRQENHGDLEESQVQELSQEFLEHVLRSRRSSIGCESGSPSCRTTVRSPMDITPGATPDRAQEVLQTPSRPNTAGGPHLQTPRVRLTESPHRGTPPSTEATPSVTLPPLTLAAAAAAAAAASTIAVRCKLDSASPAVLLAAEKFLREPMPKKPPQSARATSTRGTYASAATTGESWASLRPSLSTRRSARGSSTSSWSIERPSRRGMLQYWSPRDESVFADRAAARVAKGRIVACELPVAALNTSAMMKPTAASRHRETVTQLCHPRSPRGGRAAVRQGEGSVTSQ